MTIRNRLMNIVGMMLLGAPAAAGLALAAPSSPQTQPASAAEPEHIEVQHLLVGFQGTLPGKPITRTQAEAKALAYELLEKARKGEDFDALVKKHTDDAHPGIYGMSNNGVTPAGGEYPRNRMVAAFGDVGFKLKVGQFGIADHDPKTSPFGYHIIKRTK